MPKFQNYNYVRTLKKYKNEIDFFDKYEFVITDEDIIADYKLAVEQLGTELANFIQDLLNDKPELFTKELYEYTLKIWYDTLIFKLFTHYHGNISQVSELLGISRPTLRQRLYKNELCETIITKKRNKSKN